MIMKKLRIIYIVLIIVICISVMFVNAREPLDDDINVDVTVKSKVPTTTTTTVDGGTTYLGCYIDGRPRSLQPRGGHPEYFRDDTGLSKEVCAAKCKSYGYKYMGLQYARECFCSDTFHNPYGRTTKREDGSGGCNKKCTGNKSQQCGGTWRQMVYELLPSRTVTTQYNQDAGTTKLNTLSLHDTNNNNISTKYFTNKNVNESNDYTNNSTFTLSLTDLNEDGVQNISKANISVGNDNLDVDNATVTISSNNGSCITSGSGSGSFTINPNSTSNDINLGTLSINDSCNAIAPGAQSLNIL